MLNTSKYVLHFLSRNVEIRHFLSWNVEIWHFLSQNVKIRHFLSKNLDYAKKWQICVASRLHILCYSDWSKKVSKKFGQCPNWKVFLVWMSSLRLKRLRFFPHPLLCTVVIYNLRQFWLKTKCVGIFMYLALERWCRYASIGTMAKGTIWLQSCFRSLWFWF